MAESTTARVFRSSKQAKASLLLKETSASLIGDEKNFVTCDAQAGVIIRGPVSFITDAFHTRHAGLFTGVNDFLDMIPSTMVTPNPRKIINPPAGLLAVSARDIAFFTALMV